MTENVHRRAPRQLHEGLTTAGLARALGLPADVNWGEINVATAVAAPVQRVEPQTLRTTPVRNGSASLKVETREQVLRKVAEYLYLLAPGTLVNPGKIILIWSRLVLQETGVNIADLCPSDWKAIFAEIHRENRRRVIAHLQMDARCQTRDRPGRPIMISASRIFRNSGADILSFGSSDWKLIYEAVKADFPS